MSLTNNKTIIRGEAVQISVRNIQLFGNRSVDTQNLGSSSVSHDIANILKVDTFSNGDVFADEIPSKSYPFRIGHKVRLKSCSGLNGTITRLTADRICIKFDLGSRQWSFRWITRVKVPKEVTLAFNNERALSNYTFTVTDGDNRPPKDLPSEQKHSFSYVKRILIPTQDTESNGVSIGVYVKPKSMYILCFCRICTLFLIPRLVFWR